ncbi:MAG: hypothetical protein ACOY45_05025 [Pseudomonadota bacterium]
MPTFRCFAALAALTLTAACAPGAPEANVITTVDTDNGALPANAVAGNTMTPTQAPGAETTGGTLSLAPDGIGYVYPDGRNGRASFGLGADIPLQMATAALGKPTGDSINDECPAGPLRIVSFAQNFSLLFQDGKFVGWSLDEGDGASSLTTVSGIGIGTTRAEMEAANQVEDVPESSLGAEFTIGEMSGLLSAPGKDGKVTNLWAGTTCIFR